MNKSTSTITCLCMGAMACLSGCMVGPDYQSPAATVPAAYQELRPGLATNDPAAGEIRWWRLFDDPQLSVLVEEAIVANNNIAVAEARMHEARAARQIAQSLLYPQASVGASVLRVRGSESALGVPNLEGELFQVGFDATWVVDVFGGTRRMIESSKAIEQGIAAERRGVVLMVAAETARAYMELRGMQRELQVARMTLQEQQQTLTVTEDRRTNGLASDLEVVRARTEVESTASEIPPLEQAIRQYIHVLSTLLGQQPTALNGELEPTAPIPQPPIQLAVGVPSDLLRRRPDIQAAERQLAAATAQVGVAVAQLFPQVVFGGTAGLASQHSDDLFNGNSSHGSSDYYAAGPFINWTIFDGGRRKASIKFSEAQVDAAKAYYQDTVLRAFREVESSLVAVDRSRAQVENLQRLSISAREAASIARRDYEHGILDQLTVLDAQRQANRADMLLTQGQMSLGVNMVVLYKALGGGWEVVEPASAGQTTAQDPLKKEEPHE
ncbi:MAG: efflux transporter outer membrane subunit [Phycisphaeraceae bacterium]|nr:efflux transporter outer membrane subunit [Phycisphaeraceae bacterium]